MDPLEKFLTAQATSIHSVLKELEEGLKRTHWMWFIFPQLKGLGHSGIAKFYGVEGLEQAQSYLDHPILGARLVQCTELVLRHRAKTANEIFGPPDDLKFRSSMTLFSRLPNAHTFELALDCFYPDGLDQRTLALLSTA